MKKHLAPLLILVLLLTCTAALAAENAAITGEPVKDEDTITPAGDVRLCWNDNVDAMHLNLPAREQSNEVH